VLLKKAQMTTAPDPVLATTQDSPKQISKRLTKLASLRKLSFQAVYSNQIPKQ
jgi:hypothetical protein